MKTRNFALAFSALALAAASFAASADILFQNLGNTAPPATIGGHGMTPFDTAPQAAIPELSSISIIPGNPVMGNLSISPAAQKRTVGLSWGSTWAAGYTGPIYFSGIEVNSVTLTLPPNAKAFYFYSTPNRTGSSFTYNVTTNSGATSGDISVTTTPLGSETAGSNGFAFYSTAGETISSITINTNTPSGFAVGEFGINTGPTTTCASEGYKGAQLTWCKNICENGLTGQVLDTWIHRWINRYRDLPYCAVEQPENPPPNT